MNKIEYVPTGAIHIINRLVDQGHSAYLVGGCIRDSIMGREPKDWDIATSAKPEEVKAIFEHVIPTGEKHGTVTVIFGPDVCEVTTFRIDGDYSDGRRPDSVAYTDDIVQDLSRRDFTMNAIAYDLVKDEFIDPFGGIEHIRQGVIHTVGNPVDRFTEDALRMMRLIRFIAQLNFTPEPMGFLSVVKLNESIKGISMERIRDELVKILMSPKPSQAIGDLYITGLMDHFLPELCTCVGFKQHSPYHDKDVFEHILDVVDATPPITSVRLAALFHDIAKPDTFSIGDDGIGHFYGHPKVGADIARNVMSRLRFPNDIIDDVCVLVDEHMSRHPKLRTPSVKRFINRIDEHRLSDLFALMRADIASHKEPHDYSELEFLEVETAKIIAERPPMSLKDLAINGKDLIEAGFKPGPVIGLLLNSCMDRVLENPLFNEKPYLLGYAMAQAVPESK